MSNYLSIYEIAEKYTAMSREVPYPISFKKPIRDSFKNNSDYGHALDAYEDYYHNTFIPAKKEYNQFSLYATGMKQGEIAHKSGISRPQVCAIVNFKSWK